MRITLIVLVLLFTRAAGLALAQTDNFNRPDGPVGPNWTMQNSTWRIEAGRARSAAGFGDTALMTYNAFSSTDPRVQADVEYGGAARVSYAALISCFASLSDNVFVKIQDNTASGDFNRVFFYYGNNGGPWGGMTGGDYFEDISPAFTSARVWTVMTGQSITLNIDRNFDDVPESTYTRGDIPLETLGTLTGLGGFDNASVDNFDVSVPEPASLAMLAAGASVLMRRRAATRKRRVAFQ